MIQGCDISFWQDARSTPIKIDFEKMKKSGLDFVIIKASQANFVDSLFVDSCKRALDAGLYVGAYHFFTWYYDDYGKDTDVSDITCDVRFMIQNGRVTKVELL